MKKIEAIIRKSKFREVKKALIKSGVENFTYVLVRNVGEATERKVYRGVEYEVSAVERIHLTIIAPSKAESIVKTIVENGLTGEAGDGRIMITELSSALKLITRSGMDETEALSKKTNG
jgi:nitrogen regulatory protein P-II 1